jgi:hypothetical protein
MSEEMSKYYPHEGNSTLSTSVIIHVTPDHYYLTSWAILWSFFVLAILFCSYQIWLENKWFAARKTDIEQAGVGGINSGTGDGEAVSSADLTRKRVRGNGSAPSQTFPTTFILWRGATSSFKTRREHDPVGESLIPCCVFSQFCTTSIRCSGTRCSFVGSSLWRW